MCICYRLSTAAFLLQQPPWVVTTEAVRLKKPKMFTSGPLLKSLTTSDLVQSFSFLKGSLGPERLAHSTQETKPKFIPCAGVFLCSTLIHLLNQRWLAFLWFPKHGPGWCGSWTEHQPANWKVAVGFPVGTRAWVVGQVPTWGHQCRTQAIDVLLAHRCLSFFFLPPFPSL